MGDRMGPLLPAHVEEEGGFELVSMEEENGKTTLLEASGSRDDSRLASSSSSGAAAAHGYQTIDAALLPKPETSQRRANILRFVCAFCLVAGAVVLVGSALALIMESGRREQEELGSPKQQDWGKVRAQKNLDRPLLILISSDGFRWGYNYKVPTPNIDRLRVNGTEAESGLIPVYPSLTFPNHYSIATGLYPAWHGIVQNHFSDPEDAEAEPFYQGNLNPKWWLGEPIWETVAKNGLQAATYFWPGSEVEKDSWTCPPKFCQQYNGSVPYEQRVDTVLTYLDLPSEERPSYISLYFESPDEEGHHVGPDAPQISQAVARIDSVIGRLISGLEKRGFFDDVTIVLVGDHGMVANCDSKVIYLDDFKLWIDINSEWIDSTGAILALRPPTEVDVKNIYSKLKEGLASGKVDNSEYLEIYLKEDLPERFMYSANDRVQPIIGIPAEGFIVAHKRSSGSHHCGGSHGYDNSLLSMRSIFIGHGPQFARGRKVPSFINVELYNLFTSVLGLNIVASNNGSSEFATSLLLPSA